MKSELKNKVHKSKSTLSVISGYLQLLNSRLKDTQDSSEILELAKKAQSTCNDLHTEIDEISKLLD